MSVTLQLQNEVVISNTYSLEYLDILVLSEFFCSELGSTAVVVQKISPTSLKYL